MTSLVSDFLINPVIRQARRFSAGFASGAESASPIRGMPRSPHSDADEVISETESESAVPDCDLAIPPAGYSAPATPLARHIEASAITPARSSASADDDQRLSAASTENGTLGIGPGGGSRIRRSSSGVAAATPLHQHGSPPLTPPWTAYTSAAEGIPEDDGKKELRRRILAIQAMDIPSSDKARLMHQVLIENHTRSRDVSRPAPVPKAFADLVPVPSEQPAAPGGLESLKFWNALRDSSSTPEFALTADDLKPTFAPAPAVYGIPPATDPDDATLPFRALGCEHYRRNVKLQCAECERWYTCRFCHDAVESHALPRKATKYMLCMLCGTAQKASDTCTSCGDPAARYYCGVCKLWQDDPNKNVYHCHECGICRIGKGIGKDFYHCKRCIACIAIETQLTHKCIERSTDCDCPICGDYMFTSPKSVIFMKCGHSIHEKCWHEYLQTSYKCPICSKSTVNMETQFRNLDIAIATQPMPPEFQACRAVVLCNDCCAKSSTLYHWLGLKCAVCNSYNTAQLRIYVEGGGDAAGRDGSSALASLAGAEMEAAASSSTQTSAATLAGASGAQPASLPGSIAMLGPQGGPSASFSPIHMPALMGRSVSPIPGLGTRQPLAALESSALREDAEESDDEEDMIDFWGREESRNLMSAESAAGTGSQGESDGYSDSGDCDDDLEDDDDEEEEEEISLFGHR